MLVNEQEAELTWHGMRVETDFTIPAQGSTGKTGQARLPRASDVLRGEITVQVVEGEGLRASRVTAVAARAGISAEGYSLPFVAKLKRNMRPRAPALHLHKRAPYYFTVAWRAPAVPEGIHISHYSIEITTTTPNGTYYPWRELWCGASFASPDFELKTAMRTGDEAALKNLRTQAEARRRADEDKEDMEDKDAGRALGRRPPSIQQDRSGEESDASATSAPEYFFYTLPVHPTLFGRLRIRCWAEGESRPSMYSKAILLPRWKGKVDVRLDAGSNLPRDEVLREMAKFFSNKRQHVTDGGQTQPCRIGNAPSRNVWAGDAMPPPPPATAKEKAKGLVMAPVCCRHSTPLLTSLCDRQSSPTSVPTPYNPAV